jgi:hypothetical protein
MSWFSKKDDERAFSKTGVFAVEGKKLIPIDEKAPAIGEAAAGSVRAYVASLGYTDDQLHTVLTFTSNKTDAICFRKWSKVPAIVFVKKDRPLLYSDVESEINSIDWEFEWRQLRFEDSI